jgi:threonylcarbamoyladenosine tRNA methylthiotransferase MtaB
MLDDGLCDHAALSSASHNDDQKCLDTVDVITFGCRLNIVESQTIREQALKAGHTNVVIINTCAVTAEATRQSRQAIRRLSRERPEARIIVTGCAAQIESARYAAMPEVSHVVGNDLKTRPETWQRLHDTYGSEKILINDVMSVTETALHLMDGMKGHTRAFVQVQNGCDHRCTFCIIPYGRGNSRSVPMGEVVTQMQRLVDHGALEVVLTGVDMTSYGKDLPANPTLGRLVQSILTHVPDLPRLRLSSIDSIEVDEALSDALASDHRFMPHLHLSLQAGDDLILKRMKRRHLRDDAIRFCVETRARRPDIVFGADIIAGFPTETEDMFTRSLNLVRECGLTHLHVFPFSPREGTPAARMPQLSKSVIKERAARLRQLGQNVLEEHLKSLVGTTQKVLTETNNVGRTQGFALVEFSTPVQAGEIINTHISAHDHLRLKAH